MFAFGIIIPVTALLTAQPATPQDGSWQGWHGCWRATGEGVGEQVACILPGANASQVQLLMVEQGAIVERTVIRTDGTASAIREGGCNGSEFANWSRDGRRVFLRAELDCEGVKRSSNAVLAMVSETEWVDVQATSVSGQIGIRTLRYRAISGAGMPEEIRTALGDGRELVRSSARLAASAPLQIEDVIEASSHLPSGALEALIAARGAGFALNASKLEQLKDARVPGNAIDVMVALTYPKAFAIKEAAEDRQYGAPSHVTPMYANDFCYDPYYGTTYRRRYGYGGYNSGCDSYYGYGWGSRYGSYGGRYDMYGWRPGNAPVIVIVRPSEPGEDVRVPGRMVKGQGYTQGSTTRSGTAQPRGSASSGSGARSSEPRTSTPTTTSQPASTGTSTSSGSGSSSSGSTGRTAIPRGSGGGGSN